MRRMLIERLLPLILLVTSSAMGAPATDLVTGHYEIHVDYTPGGPDVDAGWNFSVSYDEDNDFSTAAGVVRMAPEDTILLAGPAAGRAVPNPAGVFARFGPPGTPLWVLPQTQVDGALFLGVRTTMATGIFQARVGSNYTPNGQGSISLRLVSVEGPGADAGGKFATWKVESQGQAVFSFDTTDGISAADEIPTIPVSSHTHYNWGFTKPGVYYVTFEASGKLMPSHGNVMTRGRKTFTFSVPFPSSVGAEGYLSAVDDKGSPALLVIDPVRTVAYRTDRVMVVADTQAGGTIPAMPDARWKTALTLETPAEMIRNGVGVDPATASAGLASPSWAGAEMVVTGTRGPGAFNLLEGGSVLVDGQGGGIPIPSEGRAVTLAFGETGIYRVEGILRAERTGEGVHSTPFSFTVGAGIGPGFSYAEWGSSFEKTAGVPTGTLGDPLADHDGDGIPNSVEFALFWHGLDPTRADAHLMPVAGRKADGTGTFEFLRDTHKDRLLGTGWIIRPAASTDLRSWTVRSSAAPGSPLGLFERSTGEGNAQGGIWRRVLELPPVPAPVPAAFFRLHVTSP